MKFLAFFVAFAIASVGAAPVPNAEAEAAAQTASVDTFGNSGPPGWKREPDAAAQTASPATFGQGGQHGW